MSKYRKIFAHFLHIPLESLYNFLIQKYISLPVIMSFVEPSELDDGLGGNVNVGPALALG